MGKIVRGKKVSRCSALYPTLYTQRADRFEKKKRGEGGERENARRNKNKTQRGRREDGEEDDSGGMRYKR